MIVSFVMTLFLILFFLWPLVQEMERRDALLLNATLSNNATQFVSEEWLRAGGVLVNSTEDEELKGAARPVQPDWSLVLGTFHHTKDENFEEFLISAGLSFFTRTIILSTSPSVTFERVFQDDDDYYDLPGDNYPDVKYWDGEGGGGWGYEKDKKFQVVLTTSSIVTLKQRFRLGHPFTKQDYDGTPSKNTLTFVAPNVLYHFKEKEHVNTSIYHNFDQEGLITTIISGRTGMQARRHFRREEDV
ncbi:hypothetical protein O3P69_002182 [Scylla paramamosain]|uniref:Uncharacterized protein n=1 Tax=Scylla paramamosain TaxID=85552 RepID=A0AAW0V841_SCYPA